jgi:zinc transporter ZupT
MRRILESTDTKPWGDVVAASFILMLATFSGVLFVAAAKIIRRIRQKDFDKVFWYKINNIVIPSFGAGALLATAVFLILPEALSLLGSSGETEHHEEEEHGGEEDHGAEEENATEALGNATRFLFRLLQQDEDGHENEMHGNETSTHGNETSIHEDEEHHEEEEAHADHGAEVAAYWKLGASVLGGFLFPMITSGFFSHSHHHMSAEDFHKSEVEKTEATSLKNGVIDVDEYEDELTKTADGTVATVTESKVHDWGLVLSILIGDGLHNFCDGVFIGTAFLLCGKSFAYSMVASTVYHELAQEISDFALLVTLGGLGTIQALACNLLSGSFVLLGSLLAMGIEFSNTATGSILAISSGTFIYIAASECIPRIQAARHGWQDNLLFVVFFVCGAVPIGLVLLNHKHCEG